jgi:hypothetical protein
LRRGALDASPVERLTEWSASRARRKRDSPDSDDWDIAEKKEPAMKRDRIRKRELVTSKYVDFHSVSDLRVRGLSASVGS